MSSEVSRPAPRERMDAILAILREAPTSYMRGMDIAVARGNKRLYADTYQMLNKLLRSGEVERVPPEEMSRRVGEYIVFDQGVGWRAVNTAESEDRLHSELLTLSRRLRAKAAFRELRREHG